MLKIQHRLNAYYFRGKALNSIPVKGKNNYLQLKMNISDYYGTSSSFFAINTPVFFFNLSLHNWFDLKQYLYKKMKGSIDTRLESIAFLVNSNKYLLHLIFIPFYSAS